MYIFFVLIQYIQASIKTIRVVPQIEILFHKYLRKKFDSFPTFSTIKKKIRNAQKTQFRYIRFQCNSLIDFHPPNTGNRIGRGNLSSIFLQTHTFTLVYVHAHIRTTNAFVTRLSPNATMLTLSGAQTHQRCTRCGVFRLL